jgi:hypothetical protein
MGPIWRQRCRFVVILASFVTAFLAVGFACVQLLDRANIGYRRVNLDHILHLDRRLAPAVDEAARMIVVLGDSLIMGQGKGPSSTLSARLDRSLRTPQPGRPDYALRDVTTSGLSMFTVYYLSGRVAELRPDIVLLEFNLFWLSDFWHSRDRSELSGWIPASWWGEAVMLPMREVGLTADRVVLYRTLLGLGLETHWRSLQHEQSRAGRAYWALARWLQRRAGMPRGFSRLFYQLIQKGYGGADGRGRATRDTVDLLLGRALTGLEERDPTLEMLAAVLSRFEDANIDVIVFVPPHNVEHFRDLGYDVARLRLTIDRIDEVVRRHGARLLDLHTLLPDAAFRDHLDHPHGRRGDVSLDLVADELIRVLGIEPAAQEHP